MLVVYIELQFGLSLDDTVVKYSHHFIQSAGYTHKTEMNHASDKWSQLMKHEICLWNEKYENAFIHFLRWIEKCGSKHGKRSNPSNWMRHYHATGFIISIMTTPLTSYLCSYLSYIRHTHQAEWWDTCCKWDAITHIKWWLDWLDGKME